MLTSKKSVSSLRANASVRAIAARWRDVAGVLKEQSEREECDPDLFARAGMMVGELADLEEGFFRDALALPE